MPLGSWGELQDSPGVDQQIDHDPARIAAVAAALDAIEEGHVIGLGSGRAVFLLIEEIGKKWPGTPPLSAVVASDATAARARAAGITVVDLNDVDDIDLGFDGADEIDPHLGLIKGAGAALLREKMVVAITSRLIVLAEEKKLVRRLGETRSLPVEVVPFGWSHTLERLIDLAGSAELWTDGTETPFVTDNGNYLVDVPVPDDVDIAEFGVELSCTLGVIEHGLFLDQASEAIVGNADGSVRILTRP